MGSGVEPTKAAPENLDMQLGHATKCRIPSPEFPGEEGWYFNFGDAEGTTEQAFSLSFMISQGH